MRYQTALRPDAKYDHLTCRGRHVKEGYIILSLVARDTIKIPTRLGPGSTIGVVAPAGPYDRDTFDQGIKSLKDMGFDVVIPPGLLDENGYLAGTDPHRAHYVNQLFADDRVDGIICARGGYGSMRLLALLDYQLIAENPKIFIGFSDITVLLSVLTDRCGLVTFHGPVVTSLANAPDRTRGSLVRAITSGDRIEVKANGGLTIHPGRSSGVVCGGNLTTLCHLVGTPCEPKFAGKVLFLEDRAEAPYGIDRMLTHMKLAGCFDNLAGIILGSFEECGPLDDVCNIAAECFRDESFPIFAGLEVGHAEINLTLPFGIEATLDAANHVLSYHHAATVASEDRGQISDDRGLRADVR